MRFDATCPHCKESVAVDTLYAGTLRPCAACGRPFPVVVTPEVASALRQRGAEKRTPPPKPTKRLEHHRCNACDVVSALQVTSASQATVFACPRCGARTPLADARARAAQLETALDLTWRALLTGASRALLPRLLAERGLPASVLADVAAELIHLPFVRQRAMGKVDHALRLQPPAECDLCPAPLARSPAAIAITWKTPETQERELSPWSALTLFAGVTVSETRTYGYELAGVYYLCDPCEGMFRGLRRLVGGSYAGYPVNQGYQLADVRRL